MRGRDVKRKMRGRDVKSDRGKSPAVIAMAVSASATTTRTGGGRGGGGGGGEGFIDLSAEKIGFPGSLRFVF